eukprot:TRINITY_DN559_c0_g2_i7.p1 TRINITY_DN559_c0_g2~~TRINITY_DN559_c0_g2_i7.p1  ORF type:complete len:261 (+),score=55.02 TRINITY_DN559_c0_g2_i7:521-1303(+)
MVSLLAKKGGLGKGVLYFLMHYNPYTIPPPFQHDYSVYNHTVTQLLRTSHAIKDAISGSKFPLYQIKMQKIEEIFGDVRHHWNLAYDKAQMIFNSETITGVVKLQHSMLYGGSDVSTGHIQNGIDFLELINYGKNKSKKIFFTYCLLDDNLNFTSTGASFYEDFTSKHAMHSACSEYVRYAGEFHVIEEDGIHTLVVDNNSGTYAPREDYLDLVKLAFEVNFPGLKVAVVHWASPDLKRYKAAVLKYNADTSALKQQNKK